MQTTSSVDVEKRARTTLRTTAAIAALLTLTGLIPASAPAAAQGRLQSERPPSRQEGQSDRTLNNAQTSGEPGATPAPEDYLRKMIEGSKSSFQARQLVVYLGAQQSAAVLDVRSSPAGTFVRAERATGSTRVWRSESHGIVADEDAAQEGGDVAMEDAAPPHVPLELPMITRKYDVGVGTPDQVLGIDVIPLELVRRSDDRLVEKLWIDPASGMVYRRELFGSKGELVGMSTMLDMEWGEAGEREPYSGTEPSKVVAAAREGAPPRLPYGYRLVSSYTMDAAGVPATHWVYSDGLHALSVFKRAGQLKSPRRYEPVSLTQTEGFSGPGPGTWIWQGGGHTYTLVADEPQLDPGKLTDAFPQGGPSVASRLGSWWAKGFRAVWSFLT